VLRIPKVDADAICTIMRLDIGEYGVSGINQEYPGDVCILCSDIMAGNQGEIPNAFIDCLIAGVDKVKDFFSVYCVCLIDIMTEIRGLRAINKEAIPRVIED
jgi:hypothetical protein